jgi:hypothetical protein
MTDSARILPISWVSARGPDSSIEASRAASGEGQAVASL